MAGPVRQPIDVDRLTQYLEANTPLRGPVTVQQFGYGQSNPTYLLTCFTTDSPASTATSASPDAAPTPSQYVLRKKPPGQLLNPTAHAVEREHAVLSALFPTAVPVPQTITLCTDASVIGSAFYIMTYLRGRIFSNPALPGVSASERRAMWTSALTTLATLHSVSPAAVGLERFGRPAGFYARQLKTIHTISTAQSKDAGPIPGFEHLTAYFEKTMPADVGAPTVMHGDYKIDNLVFHATEPRVVGILDWELCTLGHPLADVSNLLTPYITASAPGSSITPDVSGSEFLPGATPGLLSFEEARSVYEKAAGRKVEALRWGLAFGFLRNAMITQGITARVARGQASSARAAEYGRVTPRLSRVA
ncbi:kinase-like domain-containing protein, partial [Geopyxis carbonaria]